MSQPAAGNTTSIDSARDRKENKTPTARPKSTIEPATRPASRATASTPRPASRATAATASSARNATARASTPSTSTPLRTAASTRSSKPDDGKRPGTATGSRATASASKPAAGGLMGSRYAADEPSPAAKKGLTASTSAASRSTTASMPTPAAVKRLSGTPGGSAVPDKTQGRSTPTRARADSKSSSSVASAPRLAAARPLSSASKTTARSSTGSRSSVDSPTPAKAIRPKPGAIATTQPPSARAAPAKPIKLASPISLDGPNIPSDVSVVSEPQPKPSNRGDRTPTEQQGTPPMTPETPGTPEQPKPEPLAASKYAERSQSPESVAEKASQPAPAPATGELDSSTTTLPVTGTTESRASELATPAHPEGAAGSEEAVGSEEVVGPAQVVSSEEATGTARAEILEGATSSEETASPERTTNPEHAISADQADSLEGAAGSTSRRDESEYNRDTLERMHAKYVVDTAAMQGRCTVSKDERHSKTRQYLNEYAQGLLHDGKIDSCHLEEMGLGGGLEVVVTGTKSAVNASGDHAITDNQLQQLQQDLESKTNDLGDTISSRDLLQSELSKVQAELDTIKTDRETSQKLADQLKQKSKLLDEAKTAGLAATAEAEKFLAQNKELLESKVQMGKEIKESESQLSGLRGELQKYKQDAARVPELLAELETCKKVLKEIEGSREQVFERSLETHRQQVTSLESELRSVRQATSSSDQRREAEARVKAEAEAKQKAEITKLQQQVADLEAEALVKADTEATQKTEFQRLQQNISDLEAELKSADEALDVSQKFAKHAADEKSDMEATRDKELQAQHDEIEALEKELEAMRKSVKASEQRADNEVGFRALHEKEAEQQLEVLRNDIGKLQANVAAAEKRADNEARSREEVEQRGDKALQEQRRELADECVKLNKELEARKQAFQRLEDFFRADEERIPELQAEIDTLDAKVEDLEQNNAALRDAQNEDEAKIKQLEVQLGTAKDASTTHGNRIVELEALLSTAQEAHKANEVLTKQLEELEAILVTAKGTSDTHEAKSKQLAAQVDRLIGDRKNIQFERDQFEEDKDRIERKLTDITSALSLSYGQGMTRLRESGIDSDALLGHPHMHSRSSSDAGFSLLEEINRSRAVLDAFTRFNPPEEQGAVDGQLQALLDMGMPVPPGSVEEPFVPMHWKEDVSKHLESRLSGLREELDKVMKYMNLDKNHFLHEWHIAETFGHLQVERLQRISDDYMALVGAVVEKVATKDSEVPPRAASDQRDMGSFHNSSRSTTRKGSVESIVFSNNGDSPLITMPDMNGLHKTPSIERLLDAQRMTDASLLALANKVRSIRSFHDNRHLVS